MFEVPDVLAHRHLTLLRFTSNLLRALRVVFPDLSDKDMVCLHQQVSIPAAHLEANIHLSSATYLFHSFETGDPIPYDEMKHGEVGYTLQDIRTRKIVKFDKKLRFDSRGYIGRPILTLEPALACRKGSKEIDLRVPKLLFEFYAKMPKHAVTNGGYHEGSVGGKEELAGGY